MSGYWLISSNVYPYCISWLCDVNIHERNNKQYYLQFAALFDIDILMYIFMYICMYKYKKINALSLRHSIKEYLKTKKKTV